VENAQRVASDERTVTGSIDERLGSAANELQCEQTSPQFLVDAHRPQVRGALLMLLGTLCLCPLPGIGTVVGAAVFAMAVMSWHRVGEMNLPARLGGFGLTRERALSALRILARFHHLAARNHRPRLHALVDRLPNRVMAGGVALIALPRPLGNVLPGLALVFAGMGLLRRDGLALLLAAGSGLLGITWPLAPAVAAWSSPDAAVLRMIGT
jgi:hypothetical protein